MPHDSRNTFQIIRNVLYTFASVVLFFAGVILYGLILHLRDIPLEEALKAKGLTEIKDPTIIIDRKNYILQLYSEDILIKNYRAVFGKNSANIKKSAEDHVTPSGKYFVCSIDTNSNYHKFFQINYPNQRDASEAYKNGYITKDELTKIVTSLNTSKKPCSNTRLGGNIGIHGIGEFDFIFRNLPFAFNWTNGSVAVNNKNIDELYHVISVGTKVEIRN